MKYRTIQWQFGFSLFMFFLTGFIGAIKHDTFLMFMCGFWAINSIYLDYLSNNIETPKEGPKK
jgi:hypothetical protein